jgi:two-component system LytT family response regulator
LVEDPAAEENDTKHLTRLTAEYQGKLILVDVHEIIFAYSEDNYVFIKTFDKKLISRYTLSSLAERLDPKSFFRTHRSYLVNLDKVLEIVPSFHGTYSGVVEDREESKVPVSRIQTKELRKLLLF